MWSVQVGAFGTKTEADEFAAELRTIGFEARVDGTAAPFRVRFGRYPTRDAAQRAMQDYKTRARADAFLTQVPRG
jgi:cell division protein FtsN